MVKKVGVILMGIFLVVIIGINLTLHFTKDTSTDSSMSGMAIKGIPKGINVSLIAFILQWVILLLVVLFAYTRFLKHRKEEEQKVSDFVIPLPRSKAETNIDIFYNLLKEKQSLTIGIIAKAFKITKEQALDWAKVLEEHNMVSIEYPAFSDPEVKIELSERKKNLIKKVGEDKKDKQQKQITKEKDLKKIVKDEAVKYNLPVQQIEKKHTDTTKPVTKEDLLKRIKQDKNN